MNVQQNPDRIPCPQEVFTVVQNFHAHVEAYKDVVRGDG